jgi:hypothetical protein
VGGGGWKLSGGGFNYKRGGDDYRSSTLAARTAGGMGMARLEGRGEMSG